MSEFTNIFINYLNESLDVINSVHLGPLLKRVKNISDVRDGVILAGIVQRFESACGRKSKTRGGNPYKFVEEWLVTVGNMPYIPHYGQFVRHILRECDAQLIANIFGIVSMTMYNNRSHLINKLNVEVIFLLLGEPLISKIGKSESFRIEKDEKLATMISNRQLHKELSELTQEMEQLKLDHQKQIDTIKEEMLHKDEEHEKVIAKLYISISGGKKKITEQEKIINDLQKTVDELRDENNWKTLKFDSLKSIIDGDNKKLVDTSELMALKEKMNIMQDQIKQMNSELDVQIGVK